jgi:hypothetical protein
MTDTQTPKLVSIAGSGATTDRSEKLLDALNETLGEHGLGMPITAIIGVLELLKHALITGEALGDGLE